MNVTFRQLRAFLAVADLGGFTRAAAAIGLSQSATSITVRELETELGLKLLNRTTRQVGLTDAGAKLAATSLRLITELDSCLAEIRDIGVQRKGRVSVACVPSIAGSLMSSWWLSAQESLPHVEIVLSDDSAAEIFRRVRLGEIEIGIASSVGNLPDLHCSELLSDPLRLVCRKDHWFAKKKTVHWNDLAGQRLVMLGSTSGSHEMIRRHLINLKIEVDVVMELAQPNSVLNMVRAGIGISIMPLLALPTTGDLTVISKPLHPSELVRTITAIRKPDRSLSPAAQALWDLILKAATLK